MSGAAFQRPQVIVCVPATYRRPPVQGVSLLKADCGHGVWVSPVTLAMRQEEEIETACYACIPRGGTHTGVHPLHRAEAQAHGMTDEEIDRGADELNNLLRRD